MDMTYSLEDKLLELKLTGEIDHHNARQARTGIDALIELHAPERVYLDLSEISFCDSSGLGLVMGRMKKAADRGGMLIVRDPSAAVSKILHIAGMDKLVKIERKPENKFPGGSLELSRKSTRKF